MPTIAVSAQPLPYLLSKSLGLVSVGPLIGLERYNC
jgi:hypothetical protein